MPSPFPGMDPFIEACGLWDDFHHHMIASIAGQFADMAPRRYVVRTGERSYLVLVDEEGKNSYPFPDVSVTRPRGRKKGEPALSGTAHVLRAFIEEEHRETFIEIYETGPEMRLVTTIEVLSPSNKRHDTLGWDLYQRKRQSILLGDVSLVEIDLLRSGRRMPMLDPWPTCPYMLLVARARHPQTCRVWEAHFQEPLPPIPIPLTKPDPDLILNLQPLIDTIYRRFRYEESIKYTAELTPPFSLEEAAWWRRQATAKKTKA